MDILSSERCSSDNTFAAVLKATQHLLCSRELGQHLQMQPSLSRGALAGLKHHILCTPDEGENKHARYKTLAVMKASLETLQTV